MSSLEFSCQDFENAREELIGTIHNHLDDSDKTFLLSFNRLEPDWSIYDYQGYPSVKWKLQNLKKLQDRNQKKYQEQLDALEAVFS